MCDCRNVCVLVNVCAFEGSTSSLPVFPQPPFTFVLNASDRHKYTSKHNHHNIRSTLSRVPFFPFLLCLSVNLSSRNPADGY